MKKKKDSIKTNGAEEPVEETERAEFSRIYFETSFLKASKRWPIISSSLKGLLSLSESVGIPCFIPSPVLIELEEWWLSKFFESLATFRENAGAVYAEFPVPHLEEIRSKYRVSVAQMLAANHIEVIPFTARGLEDVFRITASHIAPFEQDDGFRDGVIQLSIFEDLAHEAGSIGAVISGDKPFHIQC